MIREAIDKIVELARPMIDVKLTDAAAPLVLTDQSYELKSLEKYQTAPSRIKQKLSVTTPESFVDYLKRFAETETVVFIDSETFEAVFDYHGNWETPQWGDHSATYAPPKSHRWEAWLANNEKAMNQVAFAHFMERRLSDILFPEPADVLNACLKFTQASGMLVRRETNLDNGDTQLEFVKEGKAPMDATFPHRFSIRVPIFENHDPEDIDCRFRYRMDDSGGVVFWYEFVKDPIDVVRERFDKIVEDVRSIALGSVPFFYGRR